MVVEVWNCKVKGWWGLWLMGSGAGGCPKHGSKSGRSQGGGGV